MQGCARTPTPTTYAPRTRRRRRRREEEEEEARGKTSAGASIVYASGKKKRGLPALAPREHRPKDRYIRRPRVLSAFVPPLSLRPSRASQLALLLACKPLRLQLCPTDDLLSPIASSNYHSIGRVRTRGSTLSDIVYPTAPQALFPDSEPTP